MPLRIRNLHLLLIEMEEKMESLDDTDRKNYIELLGTVANESRLRGLKLPSEVFAFLDSELYPSTKRVVITTKRALAESKKLQTAGH